MSRHYKYLTLQQHLASCNQDRLEMTFSDIEDLVGRLLESAYKYPAACWNNGGHNPFSKSWYNAGYDAAVNMKDKKVVFTRKPVDATIQRIKISRLITRRVRRVTPTLSESMAVAAIEKYHNTTVAGIHTRYLSWVHCSQAFRENCNDSSKLEYLCLHLAWYLASWGMLRNSFLLNNDYLVHKDTVMNLCTKEFMPLFECTSSKQIPLILKAADIIKSSYGRDSISDTLITKVLLGIFGCVPAYDRYFRYAAGKYKVCSSLFGEQSLFSLWDYYEEHKNSFEQLRNALTVDNMQYPPMKLMDMCLWQIGFDEDVNQKKEDGI